MRADLPLALLVSLLGAALPACGAGGGGGAAARKATPDLAIPPMPLRVATTDDRNVVTTTSPTPIAARFPPILDVKDDERFTGDEQRLDTGFPSFFRIPEIPFPFASSLVLHPERQPDLKPGAMRILARSTPKSARETTTDVDLGFARRWAPKAKDFAQYAVAAVVTGKPRSAFPPKTATMAAAFGVCARAFGCRFALAAS